MEFNCNSCAPGWFYTAISRISVLNKINYFSYCRLYLLCITLLYSTVRVNQLQFFFFKNICKKSQTKANMTSHIAVLRSAPVIYGSVWMGQDTDRSVWVAFPAPPFQQFQIQFKEGGVTKGCMMQHVEVTAGKLQCLSLTLAWALQLLKNVGATAGFPCD